MNVTMRGADGRIARADEYEGYYVVALDVPALYHHDDGRTDELPEIVESCDNLDIIDIDIDIDIDRAERG